MENSSAVTSGEDIFYDRMVYHARRGLRSRNGKLPLQLEELLKPIPKDQVIGYCTTALETLMNGPKNRDWRKRYKSIGHARRVIRKLEDARLIAPWGRGPKHNTVGYVVFVEPIDETTWLAIAGHWASHVKQPQRRLVVLSGDKKSKVVTTKELAELAQTTLPEPTRQELTPWTHSIPAAAPAAAQTAEALEEAAHAPLVRMLPSMRVVGPSDQAPSSDAETRSKRSGNPIVEDRQAFKLVDKTSDHLDPVTETHCDGETSPDPIADERARLTGAVAEARKKYMIPGKILRHYRDELNPMRDIHRKRYLLEKVWVAECDYFRRGKRPNYMPSLLRHLLREDAKPDYPVYSGPLWEALKPGQSPKTERQTSSG